MSWTSTRCSVSFGTLFCAASIHIRRWNSSSRDLLESEPRTHNVLPFDFNGDPSAVKLLRNVPHHIASGERIKHNVAGLREELDKELWDFFLRNGPDALQGHTLGMPQCMGLYSGYWKPQ